MGLCSWKTNRFASSAKFLGPSFWQAWLMRNQ